MCGTKYSFEDVNGVGETFTYEGTYVTSKNDIVSNNYFRSTNLLLNHYGYTIEVMKAYDYGDGCSLYANVQIGFAKDFYNKFRPSIYVECDDNGKLTAKAQTTSYGLLELNDYKEYIEACTNAYNVVEFLSTLDIRYFPRIYKGQQFYVV